MGKPDGTDSPRATKTEAEARRERLAVQLRANLKRRKAQSKARRSQDETADSSRAANADSGDD